MRAFSKNFSGWGWCLLLGVATVLVAILLKQPGFLMLLNAIILQYAGPRMGKERDHFFYRFPWRGIHQSKSMDAKILKVIEWDGYEGVFYEMLWEDGDVWTIPGNLFLSLRQITKSLKHHGFGEVATEKQWQVFRSHLERQENAEKRE